MQNPYRTILQPAYRPQLFVAITATFFQQWTGINTIVFCATPLPPPRDGSATCMGRAEAPQLFITPAASESRPAGSMQTSAEADSVPCTPRFRNAVCTGPCPTSASSLLRTTFPRRSASAAQTPRSCSSPWARGSRQPWRPSPTRASLSLHPSILRCEGCADAPQLFITLGTGQQAALAATIVTGVVNHVATYVSLWAADEFGRRLLLLEAGVQVCSPAAGLRQGSARGESVQGSWS